MFKRKIIALIAVALMAITAIAVFTACRPTMAVEDVSIAIINANGESILEIDARGYESNSVLDILIANNESLDIPTAQLDSGFITTIAGITAVWNDEEQWWWQFDINGTMSPVGIRDARVENGAKITFTLVAGGEF